jgi:hypothetical protein
MPEQEYARRLVLLLASPDLPEKDFSRLVAWLRSGGMDDVVVAARDVRRSLDRVGGSREDEADNPSRRGSQVGPRGAPPELSERIRELLGKRLGFRTPEILAMLAARLGSPIVFPPRTGLKRGVLRLAQEHGESTVLSAAHRIVSDRNRAVHDPDWQLRDRTP